MNPWLLVLETTVLPTELFSPQNAKFKKFMIYKYLLEIKYRVFFSLLAWSFIVINCYCYKETLLYVFIRLSSNQTDTNLLYFLTTDVTEVFVVYISLSYFIANQAIIPFLGYQLFVFLSTGLYTFEYVYFKTVLVMIAFYWISFIFIINTLIFPASWFFFFWVSKIFISSKPNVLFWS